MSSSTQEDHVEYPRFISNSPCGLDLFEGKAQDKIADNICLGILEHTELKIIGIDGGWGAGKSNLVELIKKKLEKKVHFFVYDAWGHQEDLQRRSFLEELTEDLTTNKIVSDEWKVTLKHLLAKIKETESKRVPKLSVGIIITGLLILLIPILKLISDSISSKLWKFLILLIPFFVIVIFLIIFYQKDKASTFSERIKNAFSKLFLEYQNKIEEETKYETISEDEPSVKKFRDWLNDISEDLKTKGKKLVIVFDNMDRLPQKKVQELWSSIHVFFAEHNYQNIKVILPFDRSHIQNAFKKEDSNDGQNFGDDFINKTFNVVYRVSPPILSDWKSYFRIQWRNAFGEKADGSEDYNSVVQIFDLLATGITPRKIIAFINELVTIKQLTAETVPGKYIALFVLGKEPITKKPLDEIIKPTFLGPLEFLYKDDEDMPKYLAALFYQVAADHALQIVFTNRLVEVLNKNESDEILKISNIPEFVDVLEQAILQITDFKNAILAVSSLPSEKLGDEFQKQAIWDCLYGKIELKSDPKLYDYQIKLLLNLKNKEAYLGLLLHQLTSSSTFDALDYYKNINKIDEALENRLNVLNFLQNRQTSVEDFIGFIRIAKNDFVNYKIYCDEKTLNDYLVNYEVDKLPEIDFIELLLSQYNFDPFETKLESYIQTPSPTHNKTIMAHIFEMYKLIAHVKPLKIILDDARIYNLWQTSTAEEEFYYDLLSMRIARLDSFAPSYAPQFNDVLQKDDAQMVQKVCGKIEYYINYGNILAGLNSFNQYPLFKAIANELTINSYGTSTANIRSAISSFDEISKNGDIDPVILIKRLDEWKKFAIEKISPENISTIASVFFVENAINTDCDLSQHCINCLIKYLDSLDQDKWINAFKDFTSYEFRVSLLIQDYKFPQNAFDTVKEVLKLIATEEMPVNEKELWNGLIRRMENEGRNWEATFNGVRDSFCWRDNMNTELFKFFSGWLFNYSKLDENQSSLRTIFNSGIVRDVECLNIIMTNKEKMPEIIKAAKGEAQDFKDEIRELLNGEPSEDLIDFAKFLGVSKKRKKEDSSESE